MSEADRERWDARYAERLANGSAPRPPSPFLESIAGRLPRSGRALDLGGGDGRHAIWLAGLGLDVTLADISEVAIELAGRHAKAAGLTITALAIDLDESPIPPGPWDVIVTTDFLWRPLIDGASGILAPRGLLVVAHPTRTNLERHPSPGAAYLLHDGELSRRAEAAGLEVLESSEAWRENGRHEAWLLARRPPSEDSGPDDMAF